MFSFAIFSIVPATALAYIPHFVRVFLQKRDGKYCNTNPRSPVASSGLVHRLASAHVNQLETLGLYAAGIAASFARDKPDTPTNVLAAVYLAARTAYVGAYAAPQVAGGFLRTACFGACFATILTIWVRAAL